MSLVRYLASFVVASSALVVAAPASAAAPGSPAASTPRPSASEMRERRLADAKVALKGDGQRVAREGFNQRIGYLSYTTSIKGRDEGATKAMKTYTEDTAKRTLGVQANKGTVSSALNTQAALTAKALVQAVGTKRAASYAAAMVDSTKKYVAEGNVHHSRRDVGHTYRFQRAVKDVVELGVKEKTR